MNRRGFLKALAGLPLVALAIPKAAAAYIHKTVAVDIGMPPSAVNNALLTPGDLTKKALAVLHQKLEADLEADGAFYSDVKD